MKIQGLENRLSSLGSDNVKLYEKIRYMESFNDSRGRRNSFDVIFPFLKFKYIGLSINDSEEVINRYKTVYETSLDPFKNFNKEVLLLMY